MRWMDAALKMSSWVSWYPSYFGSRLYHMPYPTFCLENSDISSLSHHSIIIESPISRHPMFQTTGVAAFRFMRRCKAMGCALRTSRPETQKFIELVNFNRFLMFCVMVDSVHCCELRIPKSYACSNTNFLAFRKPGWLPERWSTIKHGSHFSKSQWIWSNSIHFGLEKSNLEGLEAPLGIESLVGFISDVGRFIFERTLGWVFFFGQFTWPGPDIFWVLATEQGLRI